MNGGLNGKIPLTSYPHYLGVVLTFDTRGGGVIGHMLCATRSLGVRYSRADSVACPPAMSLYSEYSTTLPVLTDFLMAVFTGFRAGGSTTGGQHRGWCVVWGAGKCRRIRVDPYSMTGSAEVAKMLSYSGKATWLDYCSTGFKFRLDQ